MRGYRAERPVICKEIGGFGEIDGTSFIYSTLLYIYAGRSSYLLL